MRSARSRSTANRCDAVNVDGRLRDINVEIADLRTEISILDEQIAFLNDVADDARIRAVVSETPLADREATEAAGDLVRLQRSRDEAARRIDVLLDEQDRLLERRYEETR